MKRMDSDAHSKSFRPETLYKSEPIGAIERQRVAENEQKRLPRRFTLRNV